MNRLILFTLVAVLILFSLILPACQSQPQDGLAAITILHTNDIHSALDNAPRVTTLINNARAAAGSDNTMLLDAGDISTGSLYYTLFKGEAEAWFMNHDGYDAMTIGNHEFDRGPQALTDFIKSLSFPVVSSNLRSSANSPLQNSTKPYLVLEKGGARFGLFGLTTGATRELSSPGPEVTFNDAESSAQSAVAALKKQGINKIILLSHLGWDEDLKIAADVPGIDIIIGGHTHTVPIDYPTVVHDGPAPTLVAQAGTQNQYLGELKVSFNSEGVLQDWSGSRLIAIDDTIEPEVTGTAKLAEYQKGINVFTQNIIGKTTVNLDGDRTRNRSQETNLGDLIADAILDKGTRVGADIAFSSGGSVRASIAAGDISLGNILEVMPFHNFLVAIDIKGSQLMAALENGVSQVDQNAGRFPQIAGFRFSWNPQGPAGSRIGRVEIKTADGFRPLDPLKTYRMITNNFMAAGGDGYAVFEDGGNLNPMGDVDSDVLADYIQSHSPLSPAVEGRITTTSQ